MKKHRDLNLALSLWDLVNDNTQLYVAYFMSPSESGVCVENYPKAKKKILRVFLEQSTAEKYINTSDKNPLGDKVGSVPFGLLCSKLQNIYSQEDPSCDISCILTSMDRNGTLYEIDTLWTLHTN
jgi:hypothetical protein